MSAWLAYVLLLLRLLTVCRLAAPARASAHAASLTSTHPIDDYCDAQHGNDEPYSPACATLTATYRCLNFGFLPQSVSTSVLRDGICDCCDGSDEWSMQRMADRDGISLQHVQQFGRQGIGCPNTCTAKAAEYLDRLQASIDTYQRGLTARQQHYDANATRAFITIRQRIQRYQQVVEKHNALVQNLQQAGRDAKPTNAQSNRYVQWRDAQQQLQLLKHLQQYRDNPGVLSEGNSMLALFGQTFHYTWAARLYDDHGAVNEQYLVRWSPLYNVTMQYMSSQDDHGNERTDHERAKAKVQTVAGLWQGYLNLSQSHQQPTFSSVPTADSVAGLAAPYQQGERCWDVGERQVHVHISCGDTTRILSFDEQGKCSYQMEVASPVACLSGGLAHMEETTRHYRQVISGHTAHQHDEL